MSPLDVVVIGGGPAGMAAASRAATLGLRTVLVEERDAPGGQVYRSTPRAFGAPPNGTRGDVLRRALAESGATVLLEHAVWDVSDGYRVDVVGPRGAGRLDTRTLIIATGTYERVVPVSGWTLPGVMGLGAATVLMKAQRVLPGRNVIVAGVGPLLLVAASMILAGGGRVAALVDLNGMSDWAAQLPAMLSRPDLLWQASRWWGQLARAGTPVFRRHVVSRIDGNDSVQGARLAPVDATGATAGGPEPTIAADAVCLGYGLCPSTELARLLAVPHRLTPELGGWIPEVDGEGHTARRGVYVVGDAAGVRGAEAAPISGQLAAVAAAHALGRIGRAEFAAARAPLARRLRRAARVGRAMSTLSRPRPGLVARMAPETIVCRCEDVTRRQIDAAVAAGCRDVHQVKATTRCGMGPCQARMCGESMAAIIARAVGSSTEVGQLTVRPPVRPVAIEALTGSFVYEDIEMTERAPT